MNRADVMVLGTCPPNFANPGRDLVNLHIDDVLAPGRQAELESAALFGLAVWGGVVLAGAVDLHAPVVEAFAGGRRSSPSRVLSSSPGWLVGRRVGSSSSSSTVSVRRRWRGSRICRRRFPSASSTGASPRSCSSDGA